MAAAAAAAVEGAMAAGKEHFAIVTLAPSELNLNIVPIASGRPNGGGGGGGGGNGGG